MVYQKCTARNRHFREVAFGATSHARAGGLAVLSIADQYGKRRARSPRHHYILVFNSADARITQQIEMFAENVDEAVMLSVCSESYHSVEVWEDGTPLGVRSCARSPRS
jgi:hypothetical protein